MRKKFALLGFLAVVLVVAISLPYGQFVWDAVAQYVYPDPVEPEAPECVIPDSGLSCEPLAAPDLTFYSFSEGIELWGNCDDDICELLATFEPAFADGETVFSGNVGGVSVVVRLFEIGDGVFQVNVYNNGNLVSDRIEIFVEDGEVTGMEDRK